MAEEGNGGPVADFCAALRQLQQDAGLSPTQLARLVGYGRSQLYRILSGGIRRPPEWDRLVEPLVRACTRNDERVVAVWRRRHGMLVAVYNELPRHTQWDGKLQVTARQGRVVPAQLPADVDVFVGRERELTELHGLLVSTTDRNGAGRGSMPMMISIVSGTAGVGKTALALRWAHQVRRTFTDGQLYVNLRGYDPDQPLTAGDALAGFLRALGLAGQDIPLEVEERAAAYRSLLDGRRMLVVLDNAGSVEQVRPLLPGAPSCVVLVTSRDSLAGLVALNGARRLDLDLLPSKDAMTLLRKLIGERVDVEPAAAAVLAGQCALLPLALRVAAELATSRPARSLAALADELANEQRRLDVLDAGGDPRTAMRGVFSWSYRHLSADAARLFRLLGLHPGTGLDCYAAAALTDTRVDRAQHLLDILRRAHLIGLTTPGRYGMHDLLRAYTIHVSMAEDSEPERYAALTRLFDHYLATAAAAMDAVHPAEHDRRPQIPTTVTLAPAMADQAIALAWLDAERLTLTAVCAYTVTHGWPSHTVCLAAILVRYLDVGGHYPDAVIIHTHALRAARRIGDRSAAAHALTSLGAVHWRQGHFQLAADHHRQSLTLFREIGDRGGEAIALNGLGRVCGWQGHYDQAADHICRALALFRRVGDRVGEADVLSDLGLLYRQQGHYAQAADHLGQALTLFCEIGARIGETRALTGLGLVCLRQGRFQQAAEYHQQALTLCREIHNRSGEANALDNLGDVHRRQGCFQQAANHHRQALDLFRHIGDRAGEARALDNIGDVAQRQGDYEQAAEHHRQALALMREIGDQAGETEALNSLGETYLAAGELDEACIQHTAALTLATQIGDRYQQARAHDSLAHTYHTAGDLACARRHWRDAVNLFKDLDIPEADIARAHLAALDLP